MAVFCWISAPGGAAAEVRIAVIGPMTGQFGALGEQMRLGAAHAVADINAAGGINGEILVLETGNDLCEAERAAAAANQMIGRNVVAVIGHLCSAASITASKIYSDAGVVQISPASASPAYTDNRPDPAGGTYRLYGREDNQAKLAGRFLMQNFGRGNVAFVHDGTTYGKTLADGAMAAFQAAGGQPVYNQAYEPGQQSYASLVGQLEIQDIDALYIGGYQADAGRLIRQMRRRGLDAAVIGADALLTTEFRAAAGSAANGTLVTYPADPRTRTEAARFVARLRGLGVEPEPFTLYAYAAVQIWSQAVSQAGSVGYGSVVRALNEARFDTVIGTVAFDASGDMNLPGYLIYRWQDGWYEELPDQD